MGAGRPRAFDPDTALDSALKVFWEKGYEGASLPDLTSAMGINRPSLYAAFGNKQELFLKALDRYSEKRKACMREALSAPTARESIERFLNGAIQASSCPESPKGCLLVQGALACGEDAEPLKQELAARRDEVEQILCERFGQARDEGDLPAATNIDDLARFYSAITQGILVQTSSGASPESLQAVVAIALRAWPA